MDKQNIYFAFPSSSYPVLSWSGLLHKVMELKRRTPTEDNPITPPSRKRLDPERRLFLQVGGLQRTPRPAHGCQTRPLLLPVQHRLPGRRRAAAASWRLKKCFISRSENKDPYVSLPSVWLVIGLKRFAKVCSSFPQGWTFDCEVDLRRVTLESQGNVCFLNFWPTCLCQIEIKVLHAWVPHDDYS